MIQIVLIYKKTFSKSIFEIVSGANRLVKIVFNLEYKIGDLESENFFDYFSDEPLTCPSEYFNVRLISVSEHD